MNMPSPFWRLAAGISSYATALISVPAPKPMISPVARFRCSIGPASAIPMYSDADENAPHASAVHTLTSAAACPL